MRKHVTRWNEDDVFAGTLVLESKIDDRKHSIDLTKFPSWNGMTDNEKFLLIYGLRQKAQDAAAGLPGEERFDRIVSTVDLAFTGDITERKARGGGKRGPAAATVHAKLLATMEDMGLDVATPEGAMWFAKAMAASIAGDVLPPPPGADDDWTGAAPSGGGVLVKAADAAKHRQNGNKRRT